MYILVYICTGVQVYTFWSDSVECFKTHVDEASHCRRIITRNILPKQLKTFFRVKKRNVLQSPNQSAVLNPAEQLTHAEGKAEGKML